MAIQTTIRFRANDSVRGTTSIERGAATGDIGRTVVLSATPLPGYKFVEWQDTRVPATLPVSLYPNVNFGGNDISNVCYSGRTSTVGQVLYADGNVLYEDPEGITIARSGYWEVRTNEYIYIVGGTVRQTATCPTTTGGDGGTGDGGTGDGGGGGGGGGGGDITIPEI
jgi:hypothetical protein